MDQRVLEAGSTWSRHLRPFLYESIGWFIGAFLILAGTLYFVAESWDEMTTLGRSLAVFGLTAGYSVGFTTWGVFLGRREKTRSAARVLLLIGTMVAPLAGLALPAADGPLWPLGLGLGVGWAAVATVLSGRALDSFFPAAKRYLQLGLFLTTVLMHASPAVAWSGGAALWLNLLPVALFFRMARLAKGASVEPMAFALAAPAYLLLLVATRLHLSLQLVGLLPHAATYAPLVALVAGALLCARPPPRERAANALAVAVVAVQAAALSLAWKGEPPAFFVTAAAATLTCALLARPGPHRASWVYAAYLFGYLAFQTCGQLVPGLLKELLVLLKLKLGYRTAPLPLSYDAIYAALYAVGLGAWALARFEARAKEAVLRCTAVAAVLIAVLALSHADRRPPLVSLPLVGLLCLWLGLVEGRRYLVLVGAAAAPVLLFVVFGAYGVDVTAPLAGALALGLAALAVPLFRPFRTDLSAAAWGLAVLAALASFGAQEPGPALVGLALAGAAALVASSNLGSPTLTSFGLALAALLFPRAALVWLPEGAPLAAAVAAALLGVWALGSGRLKALHLVAVGLGLAAASWQLGLDSATWRLGVVLCLAAVTAFLAGRRESALRVLGVALAVSAMLPALGPIAPWPFLAPGASAVLLCGASLGASALVARGLEGSWSTTARWLAVFTQLGLAWAFAAGGASWPLAALAAAGSLLAISALTPVVSVPLATLWALAALALGRAEPAAFAALGAGLALVALLDDHDWTWRVLLGRRSTAVVASLASLGVVVIAVIAFRLEGHVPRAALGLAVLPVLWVRATRQAWLLGFVLPLLAALDGSLAMRCLLPLLAVALTRGFALVPVLEQWLLGAVPKKRRGRLAAWVLASFLAVALVQVAPVLLRTSGAETLPVLLGAAALLLAGGAPLPWRIVLAAGLVAPVPQAQVAAVAVLVAVAAAARLAPARCHRWLGSAESPHTPSVALACAMALTVAHGLLLGSAGALWLGAAVLAAAALLLGRGWFLAAAVTLGATAPWCAHLLSQPLHSDEAATCVLGAALAAVVLERWGTAQWKDEFRAPLWWGAGLGALLLMAHDAFAVTLGPWSAVPLGVALLLLAVTRSPLQVTLACALVALRVAQLMPFGWLSAGVGAVGAAAAVVGLLGLRQDSEGRRPWAEAALHVGWTLCLLSLVGVSGLHHPATPIAFALWAAVSWGLVWRYRATEPLGWFATLVALHVTLFFVGLEVATGKPKTLILPYAVAASASLALAALAWAGSRWKRGVSAALTAVVWLEALGACLFVAAPVPREAMLMAAALLMLTAALVTWSVRGGRELGALLALPSGALAYLSARVLAGATLGAPDALAGLVAGLVLTGLYVLVRRADDGSVLARPALVGAVSLPLLGALALFEEGAVVAALLLLGLCVHLWVLARAAQRRWVAALSVVAFNGALLCLWQAGRVSEPQYFLIPAALSALALVRVFREDLSSTSQARLRALAMTLVYAAAAFRPLTFDAPWAMLVCVLVCVLGVAAGVALRVRSYVYLGTAFLVTTVVANLIRYGVRDPRLGSLFLSLLGLLVVGFMVLLSAQRSEVLRRYRRVRELLEQWDG